MVNPASLELFIGLVILWSAGLHPTVHEGTGWVILGGEGWPHCLECGLEGLGRPPSLLSQVTFCLAICFIQLIHLRFWHWWPTSLNG